MTHEYVIAVNGVVHGAARPEASGVTPPGAPTAVAWAADRVLAVGTDAEVRAISRGDSTFLDLAGCAVTPLPGDVTAAERLVRAAAAVGRPFDPVRLLAGAGLLDADAAIEVGATADLAVWSADPGAPPGALPPGEALRVVAVVRGGHFTRGDAHRGPFQPPTP